MTPERIKQARKLCALPTTTVGDHNRTNLLVEALDALEDAQREVEHQQTRYSAVAAAVNRLARHGYAEGNQFGDGLEQGHKNAQAIMRQWADGEPDVAGALDRLMREKRRARN